MKLYIRLFLENMSKVFKFFKNLTSLTGTLHEGQYRGLIISRSVLRRMRNISHRRCRENQNTHFVSKNFSQNRDVYGMMWKSSVERCRPQMTIWRKHIACLMIWATNTYTQETQYSLLFHVNDGCTNAP